MIRLITCGDGTWDKPVDKAEDGKQLDSNVCLLFNAIKPLAADSVTRQANDMGIKRS